MRVIGANCNVVLDFILSLIYLHGCCGSHSKDDPLIGADRLKQFLLSFYNKYDVNRDGTCICWVHSNWIFSHCPGALFWGHISVRNIISQSKGKIDATELRLLFKDLNEHVTPERFQVLMAEMDRDHNGFIGALTYVSCYVLGAWYYPADMILVPYSIVAYLLNQASAYLVALVEGLWFICAEFDEFVMAMTAYMQTTADDVSYRIKFAVNAHKKVSIALLIVIYSQCDLMLTQCLSNVQRTRQQIDLLNAQNIQGSVSEVEVKKISCCDGAFTVISFIR